MYEERLCRKPAAMTEPSSTPSAEQIDRWRHIIRVSTRANYCRAMAVALLRQAAPDAALAHARESVLLEAHDAEGWHLLLDAAEQVQARDLEALRLQATSTIPGLAAARLAFRSLEATHAGQLDEAAALLAEARATVPAAPAPIARAYLSLALALTAKGKDPLPCLEAGRQVAPDNPDICQEMGRVLLAVRRPSEALVVLKHARMVDPENRQTRYLLGLALLILLQADEAITEFSVPPISMASQLRIGWAHHIQGRYAEAMLSYGQLLSDNGPYRQLGLAYQGLCLSAQDLSADEPFALLAQTSYPHYEAAACSAVNLALTGKADAGLSLLAPVVETSPACAVHIAHALVLAVLGRETAALQALEAARKNAAPSIPLYIRLFPQANRILGTLCERLGIDLMANQPPLQSQT